MPEIRFWHQEKCLAITTVPAGARLLDIALELNMPLHWRCGQGTCGTCLVQITSDCSMIPTRMENNVMQHTEQYPGGGAITGCTARLACHVLISHRDLDVYLS